MAKFNSVQEKTETKTTVNFAGGQAIKESDKLALISHALTSFVEDKYYRSADQGIIELRRLISRVDPKFAAKVAIVARRQFGMRSVSHVIAGELAGAVKNQSWMTEFFHQIAYRPDDMLEIRAYYNQNVSVNKGSRSDKLPMMPNQMKKGFTLRLRELDEYQLMKYKGDGKTISMIDLINAVHPGKTEAIDAFMKGTAGAADTWEAALSAAGHEGDTASLKADAWERLLRENKLGYFALLRNLRNIVTQAPEVVDLACERLVDEKAIRNSLVLPFRFTTAYNTLQYMPNAGKAMAAISKAIDISVGNVSMPEGSTLVALDGSGSMSGKPFDIGSIFAAAFASRGAELIIFSDHAKYLSVPHGAGVSAIVSDIQKNRHAAGTNFHAIFATARTKYDNIIILSDMQAWIGGNMPTKAYSEYRKRTSATPKIFSFDLAGYGTLQFPEENVYALAGFSDKTLDIIAMLSKGGKGAFIKMIEDIVV